MRRDLVDVDPDVCSIQITPINLKLIFDVIGIDPWQSLDAYINNLTFDSSRNMPNAVRVSETYIVPMTRVVRERDAYRSEVLLFDFRSGPTIRQISAFYKIGGGRNT